MNQLKLPVKIKGSNFQFEWTLETFVSKVFLIACFQTYLREDFPSNQSRIVQQPLAFPCEKGVSQKGHNSLLKSLNWLFPSLEEDGWITTQGIIFQLTGFFNLATNSGKDFFVIR